MNARTIKATLAKLDRQDLTHLLAQDTLTVQVRDGVPHIRYCRENNDAGTTEDWPSQRVAEAERSCCASRHVETFAAANRDVRLLSEALDLAATARRLHETHTNPRPAARPALAPGKYQQTLTKLTEHTAGVQDRLAGRANRPRNVWAGSPLTGEGAAAATRVLAELTDATALLNGPEMRAAILAPLLASVRTELRAGFPGVTLDDTETLAGLHTRQLNWAGPRVVSEVVDALTTGTTAVGVRRLRGPRYAFDWIGRRLGGLGVNFALSTLPVCTLVAGMDADEAGRTIDLLEQVWQPGEPGPLATTDGVRVAAAALT